MFIIIQDKRTHHCETFDEDNLSLGVHEDWSMLSWRDKNGEPQTKTVFHKDFYISCFCS